MANKRIRRIPEAARAFAELFMRLEREFLRQGEETETTRLAKRKTFAVKRLDVVYRSYMMWHTGQGSLPAYLVPKLCTAFGNFELLDVLEAEVGRVALRLGVDGEFKNMQDVKAIQQLAREVGEALLSLADTFEDGTVDDQELPRTDAQLQEVIRECIRLQHHLKNRHEEWQRQNAAARAKGLPPARSQRS